MFTFLRTVQRTLCVGVERQRWLFEALFSQKEKSSLPKHKLLPRHCYNCFCKKKKKLECHCGFIDNTYKWCNGFLLRRPSSWGHRSNTLYGPMGDGQQWAPVQKKWCRLRWEKKRRLVLCFWTWIKQKHGDSKWLFPKCEHCWCVTRFASMSCLFVCLQNAVVVAIHISALCESSFKLKWRSQLWKALWKLIPDLLNEECNKQSPLQ